MVSGRLRPHPPVAEAAVRADLECCELVGVRLSDDQRSAFRGERHAVRERDVAGDLPDIAVRRDQGDEAWCELAAGEVEADAVDVDVPTIGGHDVVPWLGRGSGQLGVGDQTPAGFMAQQSPLGRVHDQQPPVREKIDAHRERGDVHHDLVASIHAEHDHLVRAPVREPEPSVVPAWRLAENDTFHQDVTCAHLSLLLAVAC